jgi:hypothetical protein
MQRISALALAACGALLGALSVTPVPAVALASAPAADCPASGDLEVNTWIGPQVGAWDKNENWSLGKYPGANSRNQVVCIRTAAQVLFQGSGLKVHVAAIDLGGGGSLVVESSNALFVDADPHGVVSQVAPDSTLAIDGGTLGGRGRIAVHGDLLLSAEKGGTLVTTRQCARGCGAPLRGRHGTISVESDGLLLVQSRVRVTDSYHVVVIGGEMRMRLARGEVVADDRTRLALRQNPVDAGAAALTFQNDGGWYASDQLSRRRTRVQLHGGLVAKQEGDGTSSIQGRVLATGGVNADVQRGQLAIAGLNPRKVTTLVSGKSSYATGACAAADASYGCQPVATTTDTQIASVTLPSTSDDITVKIKEQPASVAGALGKATVIRGQDPDVDRAHPVALEMRYDASVVGTFTPASRVWVAQQSTYRELPDCETTGDIPSTSTGCVDRGQSHVDQVDGDLVIVIHTLHFSRYIPGS